MGEKGGKSIFSQRGKGGKNSGIFDNKNKGGKGGMGGRFYSGKGGKGGKSKDYKGGYTYYNPSERRGQDGMCDIQVCHIAFATGEFITQDGHKGGKGSNLLYSE